MGPPLMAQAHCVLLWNQRPDSRCALVWLSTGLSKPLAPCESPQHSGLLHPSKTPQIHRQFGTLSIWGMPCFTMNTTTSLIPANMPQLEPHLTSLQAQVRQNQRTSRPSFLMRTLLHLFHHSKEVFGVSQPQSAHSPVSTSTHALSPPWAPIALGFQSNAPSESLTI
jgi:hypothetical protein